MSSSTTTINSFGREVTKGDVLSSDKSHEPFSHVITRSHDQWKMYLLFYKIFGQETFKGRGLGWRATISYYHLITKSLGKWKI